MGAQEQLFILLLLCGMPFKERAENVLIKIDACSLQFSIFSEHIKRDIERHNHNNSHFLHSRTS